MTFSFCGGGGEGCAATKATRKCQLNRNSVFVYVAHEGTL